MNTFSGCPAVQVESELEDFLNLLRARGCRSYLEVGVGRGDTFHAAVSAMPAGSRAVAVDMPEQGWGLEGSHAQLAGAVNDLVGKGYDVSLFVGPSTDPTIVCSTAALGPFDAVFIDGDHSLQGVAADWMNYGPMGALVAFHDIADTMRPNLQGEVIDVPRFWKRRRRAARRDGWKAREFIAPDSTMGIGVLVKC